MFDGWGFTEVVVAGLAAFRLWVFFSSDDLFSPVRSRLPVGVQTFLVCPWCAGFWVGVGVFLAVEVWGDGAWVGAGLVVLALSAVVGLAAVATSRPDPGESDG